MSGVFVYELPAIKGMIPAEGWFAVHAHRSPKGDCVMTPLVCWAILGRDEGDQIVGMTCGDTLEPVGEADICGNFIGYSFGEKPSIALMKAAKAYVEDWRNE